MMTRWGTFFSVLLLSGAAVAADGDWASKFKILDSDGSGTVSPTEYDANLPKLKLDPAPTFAAVDKDGNNSIDASEWAAAEKLVKAYSTPCQRSDSSWCPKE